MVLATVAASQQSKLIYKRTRLDVNDSKKCSEATTCHLQLVTAGGWKASNDLFIKLQCLPPAAAQLLHGRMKVVGRSRIDSQS